MTEKERILLYELGELAYYTGQMVKRVSEKDYENARLHLECVEITIKSIDGLLGGKKKP